MPKNTIQEEMLKEKTEVSLKEVHDTNVLNCIYQLIYFYVLDFRK
jgi:hypothetical protein